ncbi:YdcF family protein [Corynebacterium kroppenstedtii]
MGRWFGRTLWRVVVGAVLMTLVLVCGTALRIWQYSRHDDGTPSDVIMVMGAAQYDGRPSEWFAARLDKAAMMYHAGRASMIVTVGGKQEGDRYTEAEAGQMYLEKLGVPSSGIVPINSGSDTLTSARAFAQYVHDGHRPWSSVVVVTDPWHALRARTMVRDQGFETHSVSTRHGPSVWSRDAQFSGILHETGGLIFYQTTHRSTVMPEQAVEDLFK